MHPFSRNDGSRSRRHRPVEIYEDETATGENYPPRRPSNNDDDDDDQDQAVSPTLPSISIPPSTPSSHEPPPPPPQAGIDQNVPAATPNQLSRTRLRIRSRPRGVSRRREPEHTRSDWAESEDEYSLSEHRAPELLAGRPAKRRRMSRRAGWEVRSLEMEGGRGDVAGRHADGLDADGEQEEQKHDMEGNEEQHQQHQTGQVEQEVQQVPTPAHTLPVGGGWFANTLASVGKTPTPEIGGRVRKNPHAGGK